MARQLIPRGIRLLINALRHGLADYTRRRFALSLTVEGWCLVITMMLIGLAALNTAAPLLYLMFSMMCSFFVLSALLASNTMRGIRVTRYAPRVWPALVPFRTQLLVKNSKLLTSSYSLRVSDHLEDGGVLGSAFFDQVSPRGEPARQDYESVFRRRGLYRLARIQVATRFPFGLIERRLTFDDPMEILILPQTIPLGQRIEQARSDLGDYESHRKGPGAGLYGLRNYTAELPARDIHWKISARRGQLIAREYESEERRRAVVVFDNRIDASMRELRREAFEHGIVLCASVVQWLCETQHEVELRTASGIVGFGTGHGHFLRCRRTLATLGMIEPGHSNPSLLYGGEEGVVVIPIIIDGRAEPSEGRFPVSIEEYRTPLAQSFRAPAMAEPAPASVGGAPA